MNNLIIASILIGVILVAVFMFTNLDIQEEEKESGYVFLGPVPEGYDEEHFRKTGITKLIE